MILSIISRLLSCFTIPIKNKKDFKKEKKFKTCKLLFLLEIINCKIYTFEENLQFIQYTIFNCRAYKIYLRGERCRTHFFVKYLKEKNL